MQTWSSGGPHMPAGTHFAWVVGGREYPTAPELYGCPLCRKFGTLTRLPPPLAARETDGTTIVCHPALGGCNEGFGETRAGA